MTEAARGSADVASAMGRSRKADHGVILKVVSTNICGSDQHMVRGRTTAPVGPDPRHEITGEVIETGRTSSSSRWATSARFLQHRLRPLSELQEGRPALPDVNPARAGAAYGYVDMGGWVGGQAEYVMVRMPTSTC